jgi:hypothetical protein
MNEQPNVFNELKQLIADYLDARINLVKLEAFEKIAKVTAALFSSVVVALLAFFLLFFLSLSAGFYLGGIFSSNALGFLTVTGLYLILFALVLFRKKDFLEKQIIDRIITELNRKEGEDEQTH